MRAQYNSRGTSPKKETPPPSPKLINAGTSMTPEREIGTKEDSSFVTTRSVTPVRRGTSKIRDKTPPNRSDSPKNREKVSPLRDKTSKSRDTTPEPKNTRSFTQVLKGVSESGKIKLFLYA